jgi:HEAT repeat protein
LVLRIRTFVLPQLCTLLSLAGALIVPGPASAQPQSPERPSTHAAVSDRSAALAKGWAALAAGRTTEAQEIASRLVARRPSDHSALALQLEAQAAGPQGGSAVETYEEWAQNGRREDIGLLAIAARGVLREVGNQKNSPERLSALTALAEDGDEAAAGTMRQMGQTGNPAALLEMAAGGDAAARSKAIADLAAGEVRNRSVALDSLTHEGVKVPDTVLQPLLADPSPETRAAAARSAGQGNNTALITALEALLKDPDPQVKTAAALSLRQLGSSAGSDMVDALLNSDVPDVRLETLKVLRNDPSVPVAALASPLLQDDDPLVRLGAADLVAASDPASAQRVILEAAASENPAVSGQAAQTLATTRLMPPPDTLVPLLRSPVERVRVEAARTVLQRARAEA